MIVAVSPIDTDCGVISMDVISGAKFCSYGSKSIGAWVSIAYCTMVRDSPVLAV